MLIFLTTKNIMKTFQTKGYLFYKKYYFRLKTKNEIEIWKFFHFSSLSFFIVRAHFLFFSLFLLGAEAKYEIIFKMYF